MKSITIIGKRWFEKVNGNTYFSSVGLIDGEVKVTIEYEYGYGNQFEDSTFEALAQGFIPDREQYETAWKYCERNNINYYTSVSDVARKKDLRK